MIRREQVRARLRLNAPLAEAVLTSFIRDAVETSGTAGVVVGLSGGVDSSLSAALAARALGPERVHGFLLPYRTSSPRIRARRPRRGRASGHPAPGDRDLARWWTPTSRWSRTPGPAGGATRWRASG